MTANPSGRRTYLRMSTQKIWYQWHIIWNNIIFTHFHKSDTVLVHIWGHQSNFGHQQLLGILTWLVFKTILINMQCLRSAYFLNLTWWAYTYTYSMFYIHLYTKIQNILHDDLMTQWIDHKKYTRNSFTRTSSYHYIALLLPTTQYS